MFALARVAMAALQPGHRSARRRLPQATYRSTFACQPSERAARIAYGGPHTDICDVTCA